MIKGFIDHVNRLRVEEAKKRLLNSTELVSQIAYDVGYDNPDTFLKVFKRLTEQSPTEFREHPNS